MCNARGLRLLHDPHQRKTRRKEEEEEEEEE